MTVAVFTVGCTSIVTAGVLCSLSPADATLIEIMKQYFVVMGIALGAFQAAQSITDGIKINRGEK